MRSNQSVVEYQSIKVYSLVFFFGSGLLISTAGINLFSTNDMLVKHYGWKGDEEVVKLLALTAAITSCCATLLSRIPVMFDKFSSNNVPSESEEDIGNCLANYTRYVFTGLGYIGGILSGLSMCYLGGNTIADKLELKGAFKTMFLLYMTTSSTLSYWIYSVPKVKKNSYAFGLSIFNRNNHGLPQISRDECITLGLTIVITFFCMASSCEMFYFLNKKTITAFMDSYSIKEQDGFVKLLSGILVSPLQSTLIFSQISQVYEYIKTFRTSEHECFTSSLKGAWKLLFMTSFFVNFISIIFQGMLYNYYTAFLFEDLSITGKYSGLVQSFFALMNTISAAIVYYVFTVEPATKYLFNALTMLSSVSAHGDYTVITDSDMRSMPLSQQPLNENTISCEKETIVNASRVIGSFYYHLDDGKTKSVSNEPRFCV